ncbi:MAG TPA: YhcH/YjgK/YiaL family protein [Candidatus Ozemobacteraceae bacterium]|nr:YhcH/YjgK/YiaL family protein [Candidatus Ozemobacteraceae bacterium]
MIVTGLQSLARYDGCLPALARARAWLGARDLASLAVGRHEIDGERLFVTVSDYTTKRPGEGFWEAHRRYVDVQLVASGRERFGFGRLGEMRLESHDDARDLSVLSGEGEFFTLAPEMAVILFPEDAHMPGMALDGNPGPVRKIVVKIEAP